MSSAHPDRIKLSTRATTIIRAPLARGKSGTGTAAFGGALPELNSRDQLDRNEQQQQQQQEQQQQEQQQQEQQRQSGMPPIPGAGPVPWRDVVTASSSKALQLGSGLSSTHRSLLLCGGFQQQPSSRTIATGTGGGGGGGSGAVSFRRNGVASAPIVSHAAAAAAAGGGGGANPADAERGRLPALGTGSRAAAASAPGTAPVPVPTGIAALPSAIRGAIRRNIVSLPSIHGDADIGGGGGGGERSSDPDAPILVSFAPSRPSSGNRERALRRALNRPSVRAIVNDVAAGGGGGSGSGYDESNAETSTSGGLSGRGGPGGLLRGIRRLFGKEDSLDAAAAAAAIAAAAASNPYDDTVRQDDTAFSLHPQRSSTSVAQLTHEHVLQQERVNRVRSSLLGGELQVVVRQGGERPGGGGGGGGLLPPPLTHPSRKSLEQPPTPGERALRSGKSFTQRALEDPLNPAFKSAKQLLAVQEKLSYMEDHSWREKAAEMVIKERPIMMADGWKL